MKKFLISLVMLLNLSVAGLFAQSSLIATLNHEGNISVFYGGYALQQAHNAAQHGDAITLSSGNFMATNITKAITLRGAGMDVDTLNNVQPTIISGDFTIQIADSVSQKLVLEGLFSNFNITVKGTVRDARFIKSRFKEITTYTGNPNGYLKNCGFLHCKITEGIYFWSEHSDCSFVNSFVRMYNEYSSSLQLTNCIVRSSMNYTYLFSNTKNSSFINCIIVGEKINWADQLNNTASAYNCVAVNCEENKCFENIPNSSNKHSTFEGLFKYYKGTYVDDMSFELIDEAKTKFLGTDKTQVGIYGGNLPYDPVTTNPRITKCNVAAKSTADGKLSVDIEVKGVE